MSVRFAMWTCALVLAVLAVTWFVRRAAHSDTVAAPADSATNESSTTGDKAALSDDRGPTNVYAHNLMLRKGPDFRVYVRWLRGQMLRTRANDDPSFDDPESFILVITNGVLRANIGDIANYLNSADAPKSPLKDIALSGDGDQIKVRGTIHKIIPL